ncbi:MAG: hypothetical protein IKL38_04725 [Firmicutes bacterium]|nr:hypothetical protein [Bacillota bacterium]MBR6683626.1 hypothetical protein [Bacillota bacterium]
MKNKTFLPLIEQMIMILIFALAAAFCLQGFASADRLSKRQAVLTEAVVTVQNTAEILKSSHGDYDLAAELLTGTVTDTGLQIQTEDYTLTATAAEEQLDSLASAKIKVLYKTETLYELTVSWQEVLP